MKTDLNYNQAKAFLLKVSLAEILDQFFSTGSSNPPT